MGKSFAQIVAEANEMTRTHHERAAAITRAHFERHPAMAAGIDVERRCQPGWWDAIKLEAPAKAAPELFGVMQPVNVGFKKTVQTIISVDLQKIPRYFASERGNAIFEALEETRRDAIAARREQNRAERAKNQPVMRLNRPSM